VADFNSSRSRNPLCRLLTLINAVIAEVDFGAGTFRFAAFAGLLKATELVSAHSHSFQREGENVFHLEELTIDDILAGLGGQTGNVREGVRHAAGGGL
jgi:hypothetical protein